MVIGVCGYGYTGSGAVVDLLKEYDENHVYDSFELSLAYIPDGLKDLEFHLVLQPNRYMSGDIAIQRFIRYINGRNGRGSGLKKATNGKLKPLSMEYIESLIQEQWQGFWNFDFITGSFWKRNFEFRLLNHRIMAPIEKKMNKTYKVPPFRTMYLSIEPENFYDASQKYINDLIKSFGPVEKENIVLNQPFPANYPESCFVFYDNPKAIIVDKDPRDVYLLGKQVIRSGASWMPFENVSQFVTYYRQMRLHRSNHKDVLYVSFEDLIYKYDESVNKIEEFLGISQHKKTKQYFDPAVSIGNTQLFLRYPEYQKDIEYIEKELPEYLYSFEGCKAPSLDIMPFDK